MTMKQSPELFIAPEELAYGVRGSIMARPFRAQLDGAPDGVTVTGRAGVADTYFSVPARCRIKGRHIGGFLVYGNEHVLTFVPGKSYRMKYPELFPPPKGEATS